MCGIVGLFAKSTEIEESLGRHLGAMLEQMSDRGPDSAGVAVYRDPAPSGSSKLTLFSADPLQDWEALGGELRQAFGGSPEPERFQPALNAAVLPARTSRPWNWPGTTTVFLPGCTFTSVTFGLSLKRRIG